MNEDGSIHSSYEYNYDAQGRMTRKTEMYSDGEKNVYLYDDQGGMTEQHWRKANGRLYCSSETTYDAQGTELQDARWREDGTLKSFDGYVYNTQGNLIRKIEMGTSWDDSVWCRVTEYIYDEQGRLIQEILYCDADISHIEYIYEPIEVKE